MKKTSSVVWLIIFLCAIIFGLYTIWGYNWHLRKTKELQSKLNLLNKELEQSKNQKFDDKYFPSLSQISTPAARSSPSAKPSLVPLPKLEPESTNSIKLNQETP